MKNFYLLFLLFVLGINKIEAQIVNIPDANFKAALLSNSAINTNADAEIQTSEASAYSGTLVLSNLNISDLTGIEAFTAIDTLNCSGNQLTSLDLSANTALILVQCYLNQLTSLNVSGLGSLERLYCYSNQISSIDVSGSPLLNLLNCANNQLSSLDVSNNPLLTLLYCNINQITTLSLASNPLLINFNCRNNAITELDFSNSPLIRFLSCSNNNLTYLNLSGLTQLDDFDAINSNLYYLNIQNGNNINLSDFDVTSNPNLTCIQVDDSLFMNANWSAGKDATASYAGSCPFCIVTIPDSAFKAFLLANPLINTNANGVIECYEAAIYAGGIAVPSFGISDLTGIEAFTAITTLDCSDNQLTSLDVSSNINLVSLLCNQNQLTSLDVSILSLEILNCGNNQLAALGLTATNSIKELNCESNLLTYIDVYYNPELTHLYISNNPVPSINVTDNLNLSVFSFINTPISAIDLSFNLALTTLNCSQTLLDSLNLSVNPVLNYLDCSDNPLLRRLNVQNSNNINFTIFNAINNPLLTCIQVDDTAYSNLQWSASKDSIASFSTNCYCQLPTAAGTINGQTLVSACTNQNGIVYSINPILNASSYVWNLPPLATLVGTGDTTTIQVNYSAYSQSGYLRVFGNNACGAGISDSLAITFTPIPSAEICGATVDSASQKTLLFWEKPIESHVNAYVLFRETAGVFLPIDTVPNTIFSSYLDSNSNPVINAESYKIAVLDSCGNTGDISSEFAHKTINLYGSIQLGGIAKLYWNDYIGITDSLRYFNLLRDTLGSGPFTDTLAKNIMPQAFMNATDLSSANYPLCRYVVEMVYESNCTASLRTMASRSTSRSNIKNKIALFDSSSVGISLQQIQNLTPFIYPNPAKEKLNIRNLDSNTKYQISLYNSLGELIANSESFGKIQAELRIESFTKGIYFIQISSGINNTTRKIQIE